MTKFYRFVRGIAIILTKTLFRVKYKNMDKLPKEGGVILCANHISWWDPIFMAAKVKRQIFYMSKDELFHVPVLKTIVRGLGAFPVKRGSADRSSLEQAMEVIRGGHILGLFPEGTRSKTGEMGKFKSGAVMLAGKLEADIVPVGISCKGKVRPFKKVYMTMGDAISYKDLGIEKGVASELRAASALLMERVRELKED